jgi:hypothetical protein
MLRFTGKQKTVGCGHSRKGSHGCLELKEVYEDDHIKYITLRISGMSYVINNEEKFFLICLLVRKVSKARKGQ